MRWINWAGMFSQFYSGAGLPAALLLVSVLSVGCSQPECPPGKIRIGMRCEAGHRLDDGGVLPDAEEEEDAGRGVSQSDASSSMAETGKDADARDRDAEIYAAPPASDASGSFDAADTSSSDAAPTCVPSTEVCNGKDDDCDGKIDNATGVNDPCTLGTNECAASGVKVCDASAEALVCNATAKAPGAETCNGKDDDCDGKIDESEDLHAAPIGEVCSNGGQSVCAKTGQIICFNGSPLCNAPPPMPGTEVCDGIDNDCDGKADNVSGAGDTCTVGMSECATSGTKVCAASGALVCNATPKPPEAERCDGKDNDCDGKVDNVAGLGDACTAGANECAASGMKVCGASGALVCNATPKTPGVDCPLCPGGGTVWYADCDNDTYAAAGAMTGCGTAFSAPAPISSTCKGWTTTQPVTGQSDCNDFNATDNPNMGFALGQSDHNCDGTVGWAFWFIPDATGPNGRSQIPGCSGPTTSPCWEDPGANRLCSADWNDARSPDLQGPALPPGHIVRLCI
jgi:hypothetical protein